jgi:aryl-alcohol dehydrogenase-like predicted oxidoreductase
LIPRVTLPGGYSISRLIKGGWQLVGDHGTVNAEQARCDMASFVTAGITTFDCADIYAGVEELIGTFRRAFPELAARMQVHTKLVPDLSELERIDLRYLERIIDRSLLRLGMERLDLVQFHWWDFGVPRYVEAAIALEKLRRAGKIAHLAVTNFDTARLRELLDAGVPVLAHQVQYSLLDQRPKSSMVGLCQEHGIALLCYGTVAGGFLSERWLGRPEPDSPFANRSLTKYKLIIDDFGGWALFQELLAVLARIAARHGSDIASVATRAVLDRAGVAAAIVGATNTAHLQAHSRIGVLSLDSSDLAAIATVTEQRHGPGGEVYGLERDRNSRHGSIMRYELNALTKGSASARVSVRGAHNAG